jgi:hypothetical protein
MKYLLFILAAALFAFSAFRYFSNKRSDQAGPATAIAPTSVRLSKRLIDLGENKQFSVVKAKFVLYNTGDNDLYIQNVLPDCHCTVADYSTKAVPPKDSSVITLRYDALKEGAFQSSAVVSTNAADGNLLLIFRGSIVK